MDSAWGSCMVDSSQRGDTDMTKQIAKPKTNTANDVLTLTEIIE